MSNASIAESFLAHSEEQHQVQFFESAADLADAVARFFSDGFRGGNGMVAIVRPEHGEAIKQNLTGLGFDVNAAIAGGRFREVDASQALEQLMDGELPDRERFSALIQPILNDCRRGCGYLPALAFGEMVDILVEKGQCEAALRLEELWNELRSDLPFKLFCGYSLSRFDSAGRQQSFDRICKAHTHVSPTEGFLRLNKHQRLFRISQLEQQSRILRNEVQARKEIERVLLGSLDNRRKSEQELRERESALRAILQNAAEGIHWVALDGRILWANDAELALLGYSKDEYVGRDIREFHADSAVIADILNRLSQGAVLHNYPARLRARDGSVRHVLINSSVMQRDENRGAHTQCFTRDITGLNEAFEAQAFLSAMIESADDAIISKTLDGIITSWNPGAERIFGYSAAEVIGKPVTILIPPDQLDEEPGILARLRRGERIEHYETQRLRKDGTVIDISLTVSPVRNRDGEIIGASKVARDITVRKRLAIERDRLLSEARAARDEAEAANRVKDDFLALVSHELRTPLAAILGWIHILESREDVGMTQRAVEVIRRNATVQKRMIEDLLDVARILHGKLVIENGLVDLRRVVETALDSIGPAASAKGICLDKDLQDSVPSIAGDADRLQQVISNLLTNAIKFTPEGGRVWLSLSRSGSQVKLEIRDNGQGITKEFLPRLFERFSQADNSKDRSHGGLGIGLAVVRHIVEAHGGNISAESPGQGLGATFMVHLPIIQ